MALKIQKKKKIFGFCQYLTKEHEEDSWLCQSLDPSETSIRLEKTSQFALNEWMNHLELVWRHKSREVWLSQDDGNSTFFHASTIVNRIQVFIHAIKDNVGV